MPFLRTHVHSRLLGIISVAANVESATSEKSVSQCRKLCSLLVGGVWGGEAHTAGREPATALAAVLVGSATAACSSPLLPVDGEGSYMDIFTRNPYHKIAPSHLNDQKKVLNSTGGCVSWPLPIKSLITMENSQNLWIPGP